MTRQQEKIVLAADHAGYELKEHVKGYLTENGFEVDDLSSAQIDPSDDYPEFGFRVAKAIASGEYSRGMLFCGSGIGISIAANRIPGARAALCTSAELARMAREHNNSNILVLGGRTTPVQTAEEIVDSWLEADFAAGRHNRRVEQLDKPPVTP